ncbi:WYL domain containing protein [uncultured Caudovirales phage]|uniref:WYL domain containing protein n=1 Tax=uncultured Caudovirales phage TaxID=2100421 RepID=A0A6J5T7V0_9CAUD|nr:WYL domain containing protein [uncultured Caudovirales phage]
MTNVIETLNPETVFKFVEDKGSKIATVTFIKVDGSERIVNGLFKPSSHIVGSERGYKQGQDMRAKGIIPVYDLHKKAWICFYANKVVDMK